MKELKNILVAVDFNDAVGEILGYAEGLAEKFGAKIWVVHVAEPSPDYVGFDVGPQYIRDTKAEDLREEHRNLQSICKTFLGNTVQKEALLIQGSTVETVLEEAEKLKCDLMIVGTHKHSFLHNLLRESVSLELLKSAKIPLLAIPIEED
jgi:nucleotide-binding universal stress UspA family protein